MLVRLSYRVLEAIRISDAQLALCFSGISSSQLPAPSIPSSTPLMPLTGTIGGLSIAVLVECSERFECAAVYYLDQFRKIYIGEQAQKSCVFKRLGEVLGINEEQHMLEFIVNKVYVYLELGSTVTAWIIMNFN